MRIGRVTELFDLSGRGVVVVLETPISQLPSGLTLRIGDPIEFRDGDTVMLESRVAGIEHCDPSTARTLFAFLLPRGVTQDSVAIGSDVWTVA